MKLVRVRLLRMDKDYFQNKDSNFWYAGALKRLDSQTSIRIMRSNNFSESNNHRIKNIIFNNKFRCVDEWLVFAAKDIIPLDAAHVWKEFEPPRSVYELYLGLRSGNDLNFVPMKGESIQSHNHSFLLSKETRDVFCIDDAEHILDDPRLLITLTRDWFIIRFNLDPVL